MGLPKGKWGVAYSFEAPVIKRAVVDFAVSADWTPASGDVKVRKDGGSTANITSLPSATTSGNTANWDFSLSATEMQATSRVSVTVGDASTKAIEDTEFVIEIDYGIRSNTAQAGASTSITLDASASSTTDFYKGLLVEILGGTGAGQMRFVTAYNGSTKVATVNRAWATNPDSTSIFRLATSAEAEASTASFAANSAQTGDSYAIVSSGTHGNAALKTLIDAVDDYIDTEIAAINSKLDAIDDYVDTEVAAIKAKTDNLPASPAAAGDVASARDSVLSKLLKYVQLLARKDAAIATDNATEVTAINADGGSGAGAYANSTDSQEAIRDRGDAAWVTATGFSTLDAAGVRSAVGLASANLDTQLGTIDDLLDTEILAIYNRIGAPAGASIAADIAAIDVSGITDAVLDEALSGHTTAGTVGKVLGDLLDGGRLDLLVDAIKLVTDHLATAIELNSGAYRFTVAALENAPSGTGSTPAALWGLAGAEPAGAPSATATMAQKLDWLFHYWRGKRDQTSTTQRMYSAAGAVICSAAIAYDGQTVTINPWS